jgi:hypothetical protein
VTAASESSPYLFLSSASSSSVLLTLVACR